MSINIEILNGDASWPTVKPLFDTVWPRHVIAALGWKDILFDDPELRVIVENEDEAVVSHVGIYRRRATFNERPVHIGGIGGVATHPDHRRHGFATIALNAALQTLRDEGSTGFALLFCEPHNFDFYRARGWHAFEGDVYVEQPQGRVRFVAMAPFVFDLVQKPRKGVIDLCGLPW